MDTIQYRAVIKLLVKEGLTANEIHSKFVKVYVDCSALFSTIKKWTAKFKRGCTSLEDDPREGHPKSATKSEIIEQVHDMVLDDRRMKVREIAETIGISKEHVGYILHEELDMKKALRKMGAVLAHSRSKMHSRENLGQCLECFNKNKTDFVHRFITMAETWIHHYTPESKQQSKQWTEAGCSAPKKTRSVPSAGKVMASVFWDAEGILFIDYLERGKTITGEYYSSLLTRLDEKIPEKRPSLQKKKNNLSSGQCTRPQKCFGNGKINGSAL